MKKFLFFLFTVLLAWPAIGQTQGVSMRATNGVGFGVTIVQGRLEATNQGVTNIIAGRIQGDGGRAQGAGAVALGLNNANVGAYSITAGIGNNNAASGAILTGRSNLVASGSTYSLMSGEFNSAQDPSELVAGTSNVVAGNYSAAIGSRIVMDSGSHRSVGLGQNIFISGGISNVFAWNSSTTSDVIPTVTDSFTVNAPGGIFLNGAITFGNSNTYAGAFIGDGSGITNIAPVSGVAALTYVVSGGGQAVVNGTYTNGNSVTWTKGAGITACELRYAPGGSPVWAFYNNATPLYSADSLGGPWTIDVGGLAPAPTVLIGSGNYGAFYGDGAYLTNIGANSIISVWASNVFAGGTLAVSDIVSAGTITGNGAGLTNLNPESISNTGATMEIPDTDIHANLVGASIFTGYPEGTGDVYIGPAASPGTGATNIFLEATNVVAVNGQYVGNGAGLTNIPASAISNVATNNGNNQFSASQTITGNITNTGAISSGTNHAAQMNVGGAASGANALNVNGNAAFSGVLSLASWTNTLKSASYLTNNVNGFGVEIAPASGYSLNAQTLRTESKIYTDGTVDASSGLGVANLSAKGGLYVAKQIWSGSNIVAAGEVRGTNGVFGASGSIMLTTNVSVAMGAGVYTNVGNYDYTTVFGNVTASTDALTNGTAGRYYIAIHAAFAGAGAASLYEGAVFTNTVECTIIEWQRDVTTTFGSASASGILTLPAGCRVEYKIKSPDAETGTFAKLGLTMMGAN